MGALVLLAMAAAPRCAQPCNLRLPPRLWCFRMAIQPGKCRGAALHRPKLRLILRLTLGDLGCMAWRMDSGQAPAASHRPMISPNLASHRRGKAKSASGPHPSAPLALPAPCRRGAVRISSSVLQAARCVPVCMPRHQPTMRPTPRQPCEAVFRWYGLLCEARLTCLCSHPLLAGQPNDGYCLRACCAVQSRLRFRRPASRQLSSARRWSGSSSVSARSADQTSSRSFVQDPVHTSNPVRPDAILPAVCTRGPLWAVPGKPASMNGTVLCVDVKRNSEPELGLASPLCPSLALPRSSLHALPPTHIRRLCHASCGIGVGLIIQRPNVPCPAVPRISVTPTWSVPVTISVPPARTGVHLLTKYKSK